MSDNDREMPAGDYVPGHVLPPTEVIQQIDTQPIEMPTLCPKVKDPDQMLELNLVRALIAAQRPKRWVVLSRTFQETDWHFEGLLSELALKALILDGTPGRVLRVFDLNQRPILAETRHGEIHEYPQD